MGNKVLSWTAPSLASQSAHERAPISPAELKTLSEPALSSRSFGGPRVRSSGDAELGEPCGLTYEQLGKLTDEQIMGHLSAGHGDAVAVLFDRYSRLVLSIASKIVRDHAEAEDVAQEIFAELCRTATQFRAAKGTARMWIIRTAYRRSLNRRRHLKFRDSHLQGDVSELTNAASGAARNGFPSLTTHEARRLVREVLDALKAPQRRVLELVYFDGLSMREVAEQTGDSLESVRHRYYRGMRRLRELIQKTPSHEPLPAAQETLDAKA